MRPGMLAAKPLHACLDDTRTVGVCELWEHRSGLKAYQLGATLSAKASLPLIAKIELSLQ